MSRATVSRYLNEGYVSEEKKERIRAVIEKTGYQPSTQAQTLRTKKTRLVGVILPKINSDTVSRMVAGISDVLSKNGYQLLLANTNNDIAEELKYLNLFKDRQVDGILFIATILTARHKKLLKACQVRLSFWDSIWTGIRAYTMMIIMPAEQITELLLEHGKVPGFIGVTTKDEAAGLNRKKGFEAAVRAKKLDCPPERMAEAQFTMESGYEKMKELLKREPKIDAVFCATDNIAIGAMRYLKEIGKSIPHDVELAGIGDTPLAGLVEPALATVHLYYKTAGAEAAAMLVEHMEKEDAVSRELKMGFEIKKKASVL